MGSPVLCEGDEKLLVAGETILQRCFFICQGCAVGVVSSRDSGQIGNVFGDGLVAIHRQIGKRLVCVVLRCKCDCCRVEVSQVGAGPPIAQSALCVERTSLFVEHMADLMSDDGADSTI